MASLIVLKIKYGDTLRRFTVPVNGDKYLDLNMDGLRDKICSLFDFPVGADFTLTYVDEDGDTVTLGDDEDLLDVVRQYLNPVRITVNLNNGTSGPLPTQSSGTSTPNNPGQVPNLQQTINATIAEAMKSVPEPFRDALSNFSVQMVSEAAAAASKAAAVSPPGGLPILAEFVESLSSLQSLLNANSSSVSGTAATSAPQNSEEKLAESKPDKQQANDSIKLSDTLKVAGSVAASVLSPASSTAASATPNLSSGSAPDNWRSVWCPDATGSNLPTHFGRKKKNRGVCDYNAIDWSLYPCGTSMARPHQLRGVVQPPPPSRGLNPTDNSAAIFHRGVRCDGCGVLPIIGPRYKSKVKEDYDLCNICFAQMGNDADYIRIDFPAPYRHPWSVGRSNDGMFSSWNRPYPVTNVLRPCTLKQLRPRLDSRFIMDVNVMDGSIMVPQTPFTKIWRMRNNGTVPWPLGTRLIWIGGDKFSPTDAVEVEIPTNGVSVEGELDVAVDFVAPDLPGRYISYWRMESHIGQKFGQRVWVLIQVDASLTDSVDSNTESLNLNLPPASCSPNDQQSADVNAETVVDANNEPVDNSNVAKDSERYVGASSGLLDAPVTVGKASALLGVAYPSSFPPNLWNSISVTPSSSSAHWVFGLQPNPTSGSSSLSSAPPLVATSSSTMSYPTVDAVADGMMKGLTPGTVEVPPIAPYPLVDVSDGKIASPSPNAEVHQQSDKSEVCGDDEKTLLKEEALLRELEEMGFKQIDLNKEILRKNKYDLESSLDDLCGVAEWDTLLEELQEMGFYDKETNRRLLVKNNGSLKHVVMDLIAGERA